MAILKAPLFSLGASGKLGGALVYFSWKGLNVVREYVIPANPRTSGQTTQRGYLSDVVDKIHEAQASEGFALDEEDTIAYSLLGSKEPTPRTWFNTIVKQWLDQKILAKIPIVWGNGHLTPGSLKLTFQITKGWCESSEPTDGNIYYGTSKSALVNVLACDYSEIAAGKDIPNLTKGVKYFAQYRPDTHTDFIGSNSGIYYGTPTA